MAVVPDKIIIIREKINLMNNNLRRITQFICEFELLNQEEEQRNFEQQFFFKKTSIKNEPTLNDTFFSNSSPSSSNDSISSLVTEPSKKIRESSESNIRKLRSTNSNNKPQEKNNFINNRENSKSNSQKRQIWQTIDIFFSLNSNDLIDELIKNYFSSTKEDDLKTNSNLKFKSNLNKILDTLDLIDISKLFKIELIKSQKVKDLKINDEIFNFFKMDKFESENGEKDNSNDSKNYCDNDVFDHDSKKIVIEENIKFFKTSVSLEDLKSLEFKLKSEIELDESKCNEEIEKKNKYKVSIL
jgi:hypothetical protein